MVLVLATVKQLVKVTKVKTLVLAAVYALDSRGDKCLYSNVFLNAVSLTSTARNTL
ncbi:hypothetical protein BSSC8_42220 [Bacillus subtilis subsp. subtilis str. SC-8]|nr:hypothetical protein BSSC8_42220 [Bacillus subtilis subsp. subtilis str. SC-8]